jgi:hypothetical protein
VSDRRWKDFTATEKIEAVRQLVEREGKSYGQAAQILGCSRLAIAGVVERSQRKPDLIVSNSGMKNHKGQHKGKQKPPKKTLPRIMAPAVYAEGVPADPTPLLSSAWLALPGSSPVVIAEHTTGCRFPVGGLIGDPVLYCNEAVKDGAVYCVRHCEICYCEPPPRKETR